MKFGVKKYKEQPLGYWEEKSYMLVVPEEAKGDLLDTIVERVEAMDEVKVIESRALTALEPGMIKLTYEDEDFEVYFYPCAFSLAEFYVNKNYYFSEEELEKLRKASTALTIFMKFNDEAKKSYHLQLKLACAMIPDMLGVLDESSEKMLPASWVKMTASSKVLPSANDLYTVQAVSADNGEVWLHTHGLCRCGITELEVLQSNKETYNSHYNLIATFASYLIDKKKEFQNSAYIGILSNRQPVVVTYLSWTRALGEYKHLTLGTSKDRKDSHNSKTSAIFLYKSEEDEKNGKISKVSCFDELWEDNPIFFISNEETARMKALAMEKFDYVKDASKNKENKILIKIGLPVDGGGSDDFEHIWFEFISFKGEKFKAKLLQEPYNVSGIQVGDERWYTISDVTDWTIYTKDAPITPGNVYILHK